MTNTYLDNIIAFHRRRATSDTRDLQVLLKEARNAAPTRGFRDALGNKDHLSVIAEIKRRSPSKGDLSLELDPAELATKYRTGGAACLSVLTDEVHFGGSVSDLVIARESVALPVLRKDFTVDARDVCDARIMGADCVLLIVAALSVAEISSFIEIAHEVAMDVLVEVHDEHELDIAITAGARLIGVNQRDLTTFVVDHERAVRMGAAIPSDVVSVAESGVRGRDDAVALRNAGYDAILVGEHLVIAPDPILALSELLV